jgi:hypothetical protein
MQEFNLWGRTLEALARYFFPNSCHLLMRVVGYTLKFVILTQVLDRFHVKVMQPLNSTNFYLRPITHCTTFTRMLPSTQISTQL